MNQKTNLNIKVSELTTGELKLLISETMKETLEDILENVQALSSKSYIGSIKEARADYKAGKVKKLKDLRNV
jgi:hypothetical protein